jgi:hypothetical protein
MKKGAHALLAALPEPKCDIANSVMPLTTTTPKGTSVKLARSPRRPQETHGAVPQGDRDDATLLNQREDWRVRIATSRNPDDADKRGQQDRDERPDCTCEVEEVDASRTFDARTGFGDKSCCIGHAA